MHISFHRHFMNYNACAHAAENPACRMVLDEFHESESWANRVRDVMKSLGATHRWGLSGTPPLDTTDAVLEVAELLWYATDATAPFMSEALKHRKSQKQEAKIWLADEENKKKLHAAVPQITSVL